eukprot:3960434-Prymnesium_polylepis.1
MQRSATRAPEVAGTNRTKCNGAQRALTWSWGPIAQHATQHNAHTRGGGATTRQTPPRHPARPRST